MAEGGNTPEAQQHRFILGLNMIAVTRLFLKDVNIAATTALQALNPLGTGTGPEGRGQHPDAHCDPAQIPARLPALRQQTLCGRQSGPVPELPVRPGGLRRGYSGIREMGGFAPLFPGTWWRREMTFPGADNSRRKPAKLALDNGNGCINRSRRGGRPGRPPNQQLIICYAGRRACAPYGLC